MEPDLSRELVSAHLSALRAALCRMRSPAAQVHVVNSCCEDLLPAATQLYALIAQTGGDVLVPLAILVHCLTSVQASSPNFREVPLVQAPLPDVWTSVPPMSLGELLVVEHGPRHLAEAKKLRGKLLRAADILRHLCRCKHGVFCLICLSVSL